MVNSYILNDYDVIEILENLSLEEKLELRKVSKQFNECVDRALKSQKELRLSIVGSDGSDGWNFKCDLKISDDSQDLGENQIKERFEPLLSKFKTLKTLILRHKTSSIWYFEWLNKLFPDLKSVEIIFICEDIWDNNKLLAFKSVLGPKCEKIVANNIDGTFLNHIGADIKVDLLIRSGLLFMPSIRSIEWNCCYHSIELFIQILANITQNLKSLLISRRISEDSTVWETLVSGNGKHIQELRIIVSDENDDIETDNTNENQRLKFICDNLLQIKKLEFDCNVIISFGDLENAKNLENLKIYLHYELRYFGFDDTLIFGPRDRYRFPLIFFPTNDSFVLTKLRRITIANSGFHSDFCENMEKAFPNIEYVCLNRFEICCSCVDIADVCLYCYKQFLTVCTKVYSRKMISKKMSSIDLLYCHTNHPKIVFSSMFETFVETKHSFNIEIRKGSSLLFSSSHSTVPHFGLSLILDSVKEIAYRNPEIKLCFKVGIRFNEIANNYRKDSPSNLKIGIIGASNDENELCIYFYEAYEKILVKLVSNTSINKRVGISIDSFNLKI